MSLRPLSRVLALGFLVVATAAGCGGGDDDTAGGFVAGSSRVTETGDEPPAARTWDWVGAGGSTLTLTTEVTQSITVGDAAESSAPLPTASVTLGIGPRPGEGATDLLVTVTAVTASSEGLDVDDDDLAEALGDQSDAFGELVGAAAVVGVTPQGAVTSYTPADTDAELPVQTLLERTITELERLVVRWPDTPVGPGARWETTSLRISQGITWEVTTRWRLESVVDGVHTVVFSLTETAARQEVPAAEGREIEGTVTGEGSVVVDPGAARIVSGTVTTELSATVFDGDAVAATTANRIGTTASSSVD